MLHPQGPQAFDEGPIHRPILSPPAQNADGQRAALQPRQNHTCLGRQRKCAVPPCTTTSASTVANVNTVLRVAIVSWVQPTGQYTQNVSCTVLICCTCLVAALSIFKWDRVLYKNSPVRPHRLCWEMRNVTKLHVLMKLIKP